MRPRCGSAWVSAKCETHRTAWRTVHDVCCTVPAISIPRRLRVGLLAPSFPKRRWRVLMNSSQMGAQADMSVAERPRRVSALLICIAFFVLLEVLQPFLTQLEAPYFKAIPMPPGAPPSWWHVDKSLALIGSVNLILMIGPAYLYYLLRGRKF